jgi:ubiquinone/menaquinone biosynthesis C-methylase UbiE
MDRDRVNSASPAAPPQAEHAARAVRTYTAAADHYLAPALGFWDRWGSATVARIPLREGDSTLDLCCGAGASALPAARAVGPTGRVLGIDLTEPLLALARQRAAAAGLDHVTFQVGDATRTGLASDSFDAVVCVFGVFFAADMVGFVREMWRLVRPGGSLAITTWGPDWCEPASSLFWGAVRELDPRLDRAFNPWDEITTGPALARLLERAGVPRPEVEASSGAYWELAQPEEFWEVVLGSGFRGTVEALDGVRQQRLRARVIDALRSRGVTQLRNDVVFSSATK